MNRNFREFPAFQAMVLGRKHGQATETQQKAEENDDDHIVPSLCASKSGWHKDLTLRLLNL
jgi:hypothetical protein